jgi:hypothetical protein
MALNPNIILSGQQLDVLGPIQQGLRSREQFDQAPFRNQLLEQGVQQGQQRVDINEQTIRKQALEQQLFGARKAISAHDEQGEFGGPNAAGVIDGIREGFKGDEDRVKAEILEYQQDPFAYISNAKNEVDAYDAQIGRNQQKTGLASAKTEIFDNGTVVNALPDGTTQVSNPAGEIVTGDEREKVLKAARTEQIGFAGKKKESEEKGKLSPTATRLAVERQEKLAFQKEKSSFVSNTSKTVSKIGSAKATNSLMIDTANEIKSFIGGLSAVYGASLKGIPGSESKKLKGLIDTMKANSAFGSLIDLKESGGTLGAISEAELELLAAKLGALDQAGEIPEQLRVIDQIIEQNQGSIDRMETEFASEKERFGLTTKREEQALPPTQQTNTNNSFTSSTGIQFTVE